MASTVLDMSVAFDGAVRHGRDHGAGAGTFEPAGGWAAITTTGCRSSSTARRALAQIRSTFELERVRVLEGEHGATHVRYRMRHGAWSR
jgi:hypothetical protein